LLAIVLDANPGRKGKSLGVAYLPEALECTAGSSEQTLAELFAIDLDEDYPQVLREWFTQRLMQILGVGRSSADSIGAQAVIACNRAIPGVDITEHGQIADALLQATPDQSVAFVEKLNALLPQPRSKENRIALHDLALLTLCLVFPGHQPVTAIRSQRRAGKTVIESETAAPVSTEAAQAAADELAPNIRYANNTASFPYRISRNGGRTGLDEKYRQEVNDITSLIKLKSAPGVARQVVEGMWIETFPGTLGNETASLTSSEDKLAMLKHRAGKQGRRFYLELRDDEHENPAWDELNQKFADTLDLLHLQPHGDLETTKRISDLEAIILDTSPEPSDKHD